MQQSDPLIYELLQPQGIRSIVLSPILDQGQMHGMLGADNPPPEKMNHISVLFDVLRRTSLSWISICLMEMGWTFAGDCVFLTKPYLLKDLQNAVAAAVEGNVEQRK